MRVAAILTGFLCAAASLAQQKPSGTQPASTGPAVSTTGPASRPAPATQPADPCAKAASAVAESVTDAEHLEAQLALARCRISIGCAVPLSARLSGGEDAPAGLSREAEAGLEATRRARAHLEKARSGMSPDAAAEAEAEVELLESFGGLFAALGGDLRTKAAQDRLIDRCSPISLYFEESDGRLVESARLWQGVAYRLAGRPERALQALRPVLSAPADVRIGLWARLERCRVLADMQEYAAAIALAQRISARVDGWFEGADRASRKQAEDSVRWLRVELWRKWASKLSKDGRAAEAETAEKQAAALLGADRFPPAAWLMLTDAFVGSAAQEKPAEEHKMPTSQVEEGIQLP